MKIFKALLLVSVSLILAACGTTKSDRIQQNQALFNSYTAAEKRMIRTGQIGIGFDQDMVRMSLGDPSRQTSVDTAAGTQVAWEYRELDPSMNIGAAGRVATGGSGIGIGSGVGVNPSRTKLLKRIIFDRQTGEVSKIESYQ